MNTKSFVAIAHEATVNVIGVSKTKNKIPPFA